LVLCLCHDYLVLCLCHDYLVLCLCHDYLVLCLCHDYLVLCLCQVSSLFTTLGNRLQSSKAYHFRVFSVFNPNYVWFHTYYIIILAKRQFSMVIFSVFIQFIPLYTFVQPEVYIQRSFSLSSCNAYYFRY
jgi:hypothetical protein